MGGGREPLPTCWAPEQSGHCSACGGSRAISTFQPTPTLQLGTGTLSTTLTTAPSASPRAGEGGWQALDSANLAMI